MMPSNRILLDEDPIGWIVNVPQHLDLSVNLLLTSSPCLAGSIRPQFREHQPGESSKWHIQVADPAQRLILREANIRVRVEGAIGGTSACWLEMTSQFGDGDAGESAIGNAPSPGGRNQPKSNIGLSRADFSYQLLSSRCFHHEVFALPFLCVFQRFPVGRGNIVLR